MRGSRSFGFRVPSFEFRVVMLADGADGVLT